MLAKTSLSLSSQFLQNGDTWKLKLGTLVSLRPRCTIMEGFGELSICKGAYNCYGSNGGVMANIMQVTASYISLGELVRICSFRRGSSNTP